MAESGIALDSIPRGEAHSENYTTNKGYSVLICIIITDTNILQGCQKISFQYFYEYTFSRKAQTPRNPFLNGRGVRERTKWQQTNKEETGGGGGGGRRKRGGGLRP